MIRKARYVLLLLMLCTITLSNTACALGVPDAKITILVVDEDGNPLTDKEVEIGFEVGFNIPGITTDKSRIVKVRTNDKGLATASSMTNGYLGYLIRNDGWYESYSEYRFAKHEAGKWQPWNPQIKVVMRKKENPVPMYAKDLKMANPDILIPSINKNIGFDLMEGDWIEPYGRGKHSDLMIKLEKTILDGNNYDSRLLITFPNKFDGIQAIKDNRKGGSVFKLPRYAPDDGYQNKLVRFMNRHGAGAPESDLSDDNNYMIRIRSEIKDGKLDRAMYGKIHGDMKYYPGGNKTASLGFKYYLNPDYTRNLEWSGKNLFPGVQVGMD